MKNRLFRLGVPVLFFLASIVNLIDVVTTSVGLGLGGNEQNPVSRAIMSFAGLDGWIIVKVCVSLGIFVWLWKWKAKWLEIGSYEYLVMFLLALVFLDVFAFGTIWNVVQELRLGF